MRWLISVWIICCCSLLGQESEGKEVTRSPEDLQQRVDGLWKEDLAYSKNWKELETFTFAWSIAEIKGFLDHYPDHRKSDFGELLVERWAYLDPEELLESFRATNSEKQKLSERAGKGLEANPVEAVLSREWSIFDSMMAGWSRKDPKAAWNATKKPNGRVSHLVLFNEDFGYLTPIRIFENLAAVDAAYAWEEFANFPDDRFANYRESILRGISRGLPEETDWEEALKKAVDLSGKHLDQLKHVIRENLLARWLPHDYEAAEDWFWSEKSLMVVTDETYYSLDSSTARFLFGRNVDPDLKLRVRVSMRPAIVRWMATDFNSSLKWLRERQSVVRDLLDKSAGSLDEIVPPASLREMMVACFSRNERESVLRELLKREASVGMFCQVGKKKEMRGSLRELDVSADLIEQIREGYLLDDDE